MLKCRKEVKYVKQRNSVKLCRCLAFSAALVEYTRYLVQGQSLLIFLPGRCITFLAPHKHTANPDNADAQ